MLETPNTSPDESATNVFDATTDGTGASLAAPSGFDLLSEIGRGGMGVVYRARDLSLDRDVAIKLLQEQYAPSSRTAAKFLEEARISAQLQHPGIPAIYAAGLLADGRPWLAMKLIKGRTLTQEFADADRGRLLAICESVCQAIGYAHSRRVIHRDLKPSNVMVGAFGEVQVMDWGLAKVLGESALAAPATESDTADDRTHVHAHRDSNSGGETQYGSFMGTPAFIPPEQAIGAIDLIDERSDVFGLGAILCVVLTGKPPFVGADAESTRQLAARGKVEDAFARLDACGAEADLVALAKRCLAVEREQRPANGTEVAAAIAVFRAESEARARRAEVERAAAEVRAAEQRKRRRVAMAAMAVVAGAIALGSLAAVYAMRQHATRREAEVRQLSEGLGQLRALLAEARKLRADPERGAPVWREVRRLAERLAGGVPERPIDPEAAAAARAELAGANGELSDAERDLAMVRALERARERILRLEEANFTSAQRVQDIVFNIEAAASFADAFRDYGVDIAARDPDEAVGRLIERPIAVPLALALDDWAFLKPEDAAGRPAAIARRIDPDPDRGRLRQLLQADRVASADEFRALAADAAYLDRLPPRSLILLGFALRERGLLAESVAVIERAVTRFPNDLWTNDLAGLFQTVKDRPDAQAACRYFQAVIALRPDLSLGYSNLANQLFQIGDLKGGERVVRKALELDPTNVFVVTLLADHYAIDGRWADARRELEAGLQSSPNSNVLINRLAELDLIQGRHEDARARTDAILARQPRYHPARALQLQILAFRYASSLAEADRTALESRRDELLREFPDVALVLIAIGNLESNLGRHDRGIAHLRRAVELIPSNTGAWQNYGQVLLNAGDLDGAEAAARRSIELAPGNGAASALMARILLRRGQSVDALRAVQAAAASRPYHFDVLSALLECQRALSLFEDASDSAERLCERWPYVGNWIALSEVAEFVRPFRALAACEEVLRVQPTNVPVVVRAANVQRMHRRDAAAAEALLRRCLAAIPESQPVDRARLLVGLAYVDRDRGETDACLAKLRDAGTLARTDMGLGWSINGDQIVTLKQAGRRTETIQMVLDTVRTTERNNPLLNRYSILYANFLALGCMHLLDLEAYREVEPLARQCLEIREFLDEPRWSYLNAKAMLGRALAGQSKFAEAEPILRTGFLGLYMLRDKIPPAARNRLFEAGQALAALYEATKRPDQAKAIRALIPKELAPPPRTRSPGR